LPRSFTSGWSTFVHSDELRMGSPGALLDYFFGTALESSSGPSSSLFFVGTVKEVWVSGRWSDLVSWKVLFSLVLFVFSFFIPKILDRIKVVGRVQGR